MDTDEISAKRLCILCIGEPVLADQVARAGEPGTCDYCARKETTETIGELADRFERLFEEHFEIVGGPDTPWEDQRGDGVAHLIEDTGRVPEDAAADIQALMADRYSDWDAVKAGETTAYDDELTYAENSIDDRELQVDWIALETELKTKHRFFSQEATATFERLFGDLHAMKTRDGRAVIRTIGPDSDVKALFRTRAFQSNTAFDEAMVEPEQSVGPPAPKHARAGRMNPQGVPFFYGATSEALAIAEVRPPVGSRVISGRFVLQTELTVLDVEALESVLEAGSLFDPAFSARLERAKFLGRLARRIRMPVMPDDEGDDYLITQVMADYLAVHTSPPIQGVAYGSAQGAKDAFNVALFNLSSRVKAVKAPVGSSHTVSASTDGDDEVDGYIVSETITRPVNAGSGPSPSLFAWRPPDPSPVDLRPDTLVLDRDSLTVDHVRAIQIETDVHTIHRFSHTVGDKEPF